MAVCSREPGSHSFEVTLDQTNMLDYEMLEAIYRFVMNLPLSARPSPPKSTGFFSGTMLKYNL